MANQKPHEEVRIGTVKAAIWQNDVAGKFSPRPAVRIIRE